MRVLSDLLKSTLLPTLPFYPLVSTWDVMHVFPKLAGEETYPTEGCRVAAVTLSIIRTLGEVDTD